MTLTGQSRYNAPGMLRDSRRVWLAIPLIVGLVTPSLVILSLETFVGGVPLQGAIRDVAARQFASGHNLFLLAVLGLIPFLLLTAILMLVYRSEKQRHRAPWLSIAGTAGALALMIPAHVAVWLPLYTGDHMSSTAVVAFLFIPFYSCVTMCAGLLLEVVITHVRLRAA